MGKCSNCGADTELYEAGVLICVLCIEAREEAQMLRKPASQERPSQARISEGKLKQQAR